MSLATLPGLVIARLRAQCPVFANRVAGTAEEARAAEQTELTTPHAFFMPGGVEPGEADEMSPLDQHMTVQFRVMIAVDNRADDRGQGGATALYVAAAQVIRALVGWNPTPAVFAPILTTGLEDAFDSNRATLWGTVTFRTSIMTSQL